MPSFRNGVVYIIHKKTFLKISLVCIIVKNNFIYISLHSCDYLCDNLIKINLATGEGSGRNKI